MPEPAQLAPQPTALSYAETYLELSERSADGGRYVEAWLAACGLVGHAVETPWCGAFLGHVVRHVPAAAELRRLLLADLHRYVQQPAHARYWLRLPRAHALAHALPGWDVVVLRRGLGDQPGADDLEAPGHVGLFHGWTADGKIRVLGGNQTDAVTIQRTDPARVLGVRSLL